MHDLHGKCRTIITIITVEIKEGHLNTGTSTDLPGTRPTTWTLAHPSALTGWCPGQSVGEKQWMPCFMHQMFNLENNSQQIMPKSVLSYLTHVTAVKLKRV